MQTELMSGAVLSLRVNGAVHYKKFNINIFFHI